MAVLVPVMLERVTLGFIDEVDAVIIVYPTFNGFQANTNTNGAMMAFSFAVTPTLILTALILAIIMGFIGGLFPAIRAARLPMAVALRET